MEYRYEHFGRRMLRDVGFRAGPRPGEPMPDFDLPSTGGERIRKSDFVGRQALLLTFASATCPMTASAAPFLKRLYRRFGGAWRPRDRVAFVSLYVREAHPGERHPQARTFGEKIHAAREYKERDQIPWTVAVDGLEGDLHRALGSSPNATYVMDKDGRVAFRVLWSNDEIALRDGLEAVISGRPDRIGERRPLLVPMLRGIGGMHDVLRRSGGQAERDVLRAAPPIYVMARVAGLFRPLSPLGRGIAAGVSVAALCAFGGWAVLRAGRRI
jgi:hypothetical protein